MSKITQAEKFLLDQIRDGDNSAWSQFIDRYRGRLLSFARGKLKQSADAEDIVQDTFIAFLTSLGTFRQEAGLETYLFTILRRKIINNYRSAHAKHICLLQDVYRPPSDSGRMDSDAFTSFEATDMTASFYVRRDEKHERLAHLLAVALESLVNNYKSALKFREMEIIELLFYCQFSNQDVAKIIGITEKNIAVIKHRCLKHVRDQITLDDINLQDDDTYLENLLTEVWEAQRLSCPKRSTVGAYLLGTLDTEWNDYINFHINQLGCHFCRANMDDIKRQTADDEADKIQRRIMESTIGFLRKPS